MQSRFKIILGIVFKAVLIALIVGKIFVPLHSHNYYRFVNNILFTICIVEVFLSITSINYFGLVIAAFLAVIFNPFFKLHLGRQNWDYINISCSITLAIWIVLDIIYYMGEIKFRKKWNQKIGLFDRI